MEGSFYPFDPSLCGDDGDFNIVEWSEELSLSRPQTALLMYLLRGLEIKVWLATDEDGSNPHFELVVFYDGIPDGGCVAAASLNEMMESGTYENQIELEEEIAALLALKSIIDAALATRKPI